MSAGVEARKSEDIQRAPSPAIRICTRCVMDTSAPSIRFDARGICHFCANHDKLEAYYPRNEQTDRRREQLIAKMKESGRGKAYDCVVGISGGTDSTYTLMLVKSWGLRPLAVHFDNGWNTDESVTNIHRIISKLDVELHTVVANWEEIRSLQVAFLKAGVPCIETPTDVGIHGALMQTAAQEGLTYILGGQSFRTEGTVPREWSYLDGTYLNSVRKQFGSTAPVSYPNLTLGKVFTYTFLRGIRQIPILNYVDYDKARAKAKLSEMFGWQDYGGHHYENIYAKFAFGWYLPRKFGIDKRKVSLSGPVRSGLMTRQEALDELTKDPPVSRELVEYTIRKLGLSDQQFEAILNSPHRTYRDFFTSDNVLRPFRGLVKLAVKANVFTPVLYQKYFA